MDAGHTDFVMMSAPSSGSYLFDRLLFRPVITNVSHSDASASYHPLLKSTACVRYAGNTRGGSFSAVGGTAYPDCDPMGQFATSTATRVSPGNTIIIRMQLPTSEAIGVLPHAGVHVQRSISRSRCLELIRTQGAEFEGICDTLGEFATNASSLLIGVHVGLMQCNASVWAPIQVETRESILPEYVGAAVQCIGAPDVQPGRMAEVTVHYLDGTGSVTSVSAGIVIGSHVAARESRYNRARQLPVSFNVSRPGGWGTNMTLTNATTVVVTTGQVLSASYAGQSSGGAAGLVGALGPRILLKS